MSEAAGPWTRRQERWWLDDMPPLDGRLRFVFYIGALVLALRHEYSPLHAGDVLLQTPPPFHAGFHVLSLFGLEPYSDGAFAFIHVLETVTIVAWVFAALGLLRRVSAVVTACGVVLLHGVLFGTLGTNHTWYLPMYTFIFLCLADSGDRWSLDDQLSRRLSFYPRPSPGPLLSSGFARTLILIVAVHLLFSAGIAKLLDAGPRWIDGQTIRSTILSQRYDGWSGWRRGLSDILSGNLWLCSGLAIATMILELGSVAALFSRRARNVVFLAAAGFHLGIRVVMIPNFFPHAWCYVLLFSRRRDDPLSPRDRSISIRVGIAAGYLLIALLLFTNVTRLEHWPLTHVPMYGSHVTPDTINGVPRKDMGDPAKAPRLARGFLQTRPAAMLWMPGRRAQVRVAGTNGYRDDLAPRFQETLAAANQWRWTLSRVTLEDLAARPPGRLAWVPNRPDLPAARFLQSLAPYARELLPDAPPDARLEFVYLLEPEGEVILAVHPLRPEAP